MLFGMTPSELWNSCSQVLVHLSLLHVLWEYVYTHSVSIFYFFPSWMKCFTDTVLHALQKVVCWRLYSHSGQFLLFLIEGLFSKINYLWDTTDFCTKGLVFFVFFCQTSEVSIADLAHIGVLFDPTQAEAESAQLTWSQLLHCTSVHVSHALLARHLPLLAEVCVLRWPPVARLTFSCRLSS